MSMASRAIVSNFFEKQWTQDHPQYISGLSRALYPTTFLEIAVYIGSFPCSKNSPFQNRLTAKPFLENEFYLRENKESFSYQWLCT